MEGFLTANADSNLDMSHDFLSRPDLEMLLEQATFLSNKPFPLAPPITQSLLP